MPLPQPVRGALAKQAQQVGGSSLRLAAETRRLQDALAAAGIVSLVLKGAPLAQAAYGSVALKSGRDVDLAVVPQDAAKAFGVLEDLGYRLQFPAPHLSGAQRAMVVHYGNEAEFVHPENPLRVDLHWQLAYNPALLKGIGADAPAVAVDIPGIGQVRTLNWRDQFAYLCVHGAYHRWSRLKWLADIHAMLGMFDPPAVDAFYRNASGCGAGLCARQALLLLQRLFAFPLSPALAREIAADPRAARLAAISLRAIASETSEELPFVRHFMLGEGAGYVISQARIACVGLPDAIRFPLPPFLRFLYPAMRLPMMAWRRATR